MIVRSNKNQGYIVLASVIVLFSIAMLTALTLTIFATSYAKNARAVTQSNQAKSLANACAELGIQKLYTSVLYVGSVTVPIGSSSCTYTIVDVLSTVGQVTATSTVGNATRKVQVTLTLIPLFVSQWQEVP